MLLLRAEPKFVIKFKTFRLLTYYRLAESVSFQKITVFPSNSFKNPTRKLSQRILKIYSNLPTSQNLFSIINQPLSHPTYLITAHFIPKRKNIFLSLINFTLTIQLLYPKRRKETKISIIFFCLYDKYNHKLIMKCDIKWNLFRGFLCC